MKRCSGCRESLPVTDFYKNRAMRDGLQNQCKACMNAYRKAQPGRVTAAANKAYAKRAAAGAPPAGSKRCPRCQTTKPAEGFHRARGASGGLASWCRECTKPESAKWYDANRERSLARNRQWRAENHERLRESWRRYRQEHLEEHNEAGRRRHARKKSTDHGCVTVAGLDALFAQHRGRCAYCYQPITRRAMEWDHITPLALGGPHCMKNLAPACTPCNASKNASPLEDWLHKRGVLV